MSVRGKWLGGGGLVGGIERNEMQKVGVKGWLVPESLRGRKGERVREEARVLQRLVEGLEEGGEGR